MIDKIKTWFKSLSNGGQLLVVFVAWWIYWLLFKFLFDAIWPDDNSETYTNRALEGMWMAVWMTTVSNWSKVKRLYKKKPVSNNE
jgi:hypothetical protein